VDENSSTPALHRRRALVWSAALGAVAVAGGIAATAGGATAAAGPASPPAAAAASSASTSSVTELAHAGTGPMPEGYTAEQYDAFWGAGYTAVDADALADLWGTDLISAKARAGRAILDGTAVPVSPGEHPDVVLADADPLWSAFSATGYTYDDAVALAALWQTDVTSAKARIGRAVLDGEALPVAPGSSAPASAPAAG
jgi:hypothetical protein